METLNEVLMLVKVNVISEQKFAKMLKNVNRCK